MNFSIRIFSFCVYVCSLVACQGKEKLPQEDKNKLKRPNILFAISDDQSWLHTGASGDPQIKTPAFDQVAKEGALFNNSFCTSPSCTPSRSSILSGQEIWRIKQAGLLHSSIPADIPLFTHILADAGYHVGYTGKGWNPGDPNYLGLVGDPLVKAYNERLEGRIADGISDKDYSGNFNDFIDDRKMDEPFFFWFGAREPHRGYSQGIGEMEAGLKPELVEVPAFWPDVPLVRTDILDYYYEIMWFDTHLASMIEKLEEIGELDNTIIIATSDNGMPFPRAKVNLYDWGTHMPLAIRWGDKIKPGRVVDDFVSHSDFAPTILEAAGLKIPEVMTGKSLIHIFESTNSGKIEPARDRVFTALERHTYCRPNGATYPIRALRTEDYLYIRNFEPGRWPTGGPDFISSNKTVHGDVDACPTKSFMVVKQDDYPDEFALGFGKRPGEELYLVKDDLGQINNLADNPKYQNVKDSLATILISHLKASGDPRASGQDPWQDYVYHQYDGFGTVYNKILPVSVRDRAKLRPSHQPKWVIE
ncbi:MAG: N-sulfoglucosamine sulfohydrolase [Cyclobacteriaceae bacterium]|jgi:uncharacterized sulfatase